jgi:hypothetical protein
MRPIPEWIGKSDSAAIPPRVKLRVVQRADGHCTGPCHRSFNVKLRPQFDHIVALVNGGAHAESNLRAICQECHSIKSRLDVAAKATTARMSIKRYGLDKPSRYSQGKFCVRWDRERGLFRTVLREDTE